MSKQLGVWSSEESKGKNKFVDQTADLNVVVLNTNHPNPKFSKSGYYCIDCDYITSILRTPALKQDKKHLNIVIAHKPIYEICEAARMAFSSYHKTNFMSAIQSYLGESGLYICGDKHTRSVSDTTFHGIRHVIGGAPIWQTGKGFHVEYNLIEIIGGRVGNIQKIHLSNEFGYNRNCDGDWKCVFRPEDVVVEKLYELSSQSVIPQCLKVLSIDDRLKLWADISRIFLSEGERSPKWESLEKRIDNLYKIVCKMKYYTSDEKLKAWDSQSRKDYSIFQCMKEFLQDKMCGDTAFDQNNILNIRGEYGSGKSTFLGILYIYLLYQYSIGEIHFIPAYFNLENKSILEQLNQFGSSTHYYDAATKSFKKFVAEVQRIAQVANQPVCYLIDGLDEQDVWSYSSEDSVGRGILDILDTAKNSRNVMSFSQHHLPLFKDTMPKRKYNDSSQVMYFNNVNVISADERKGYLKQFITAFYSLSDEYNVNEIANEREITLICELIRLFRRLSVSQNFLYKFKDYIEAYVKKNTEEQTRSNSDPTLLSFDVIYNNYVDLLHQLCMKELGYGYVHYAPAMAYFFSFKGFTYERFRQIPSNMEDYWLNKIACHPNKIYDAFLFIKKNQDVREYLIAMHYNRELRYYAENPEMPIQETSILNEFIPRNIAILSRKMWKRDPNKFVIVCAELLEKRHELGQKSLCNCALSMLIYTLTYQAKMYAPSNQKLDRIISSYETATGKICETPGDEFQYKVQESDILQLFLNYSLYRTYRIYKAVSKGDSENLALAIREDKAFALYNRQYLRLYYGDLTISGENKKAALIPGNDVCLKGFDFHNTFNFISEKLSNIDNMPYPLMAFDLFSICDLIQSRLQYVKDNPGKQNNTFFSGERNKATQIGVLTSAVAFIDKYLGKKYAKLNEFEDALTTYKNSFREAIDSKII